MCLLSEPPLRDRTPLIHSVLQLQLRLLLPSSRTPAFLSGLYQLVISVCTLWVCMRQEVFESPTLSPSARCATGCSQIKGPGGIKNCWYVSLRHVLMRKVFGLKKKQKCFAFSFAALTRQDDLIWGEMIVNEEERGSWKEGHASLLPSQTTACCDLCGRTSLRLLWTELTDAVPHGRSRQQQWETLIWASSHQKVSSSHTLTGQL